MRRDKRGRTDENLDAMERKLRRLQRKIKPEETISRARVRELEERAVKGDFEALDEEFTYCD